METRYKAIPYVTRGDCGILFLSDIYYIDCDYRRSVFHLKDETKSVYISPEDLKAYLDDRFYFYIGNIFINFDKVRSIKRGVLTLINGESVILSRNCYLEVRKDFIKYLENYQKTLAKS